MKYLIKLTIIYFVCVNVSIAQLNWPVSSGYTDFDVISAAFGEIHGNHFHEGIDLFVGAGVEVVAIENGIISNIAPASNPDESYIIVNHGNYEALYMHVNLNTIHVGDNVNSGDVIQKSCIL